VRPNHSKFDYKQASKEIIYETVDSIPMSSIIDQDFRKILDENILDAKTDLNSNDSLLDDAISNDDSHSWISDNLSNSNASSSPNMKKRGKKLNTKAKVFHRSSWNENSSSQNIAQSASVSPLVKLYSRKHPKIFFPGKSTNSEIHSFHSSEKAIEEAKSPEIFNLIEATETDFRACSKSMYNSKAWDSPTKEFEKPVSLSNISEAYSQTYPLDQQFESGTSMPNSNLYWQQMYNQNINFNNIMDMNCFKLLNEKLVALTGLKYQRPMFEVCSEYLVVYLMFNL